MGPFQNSSPLCSSLPLDESQRLQQLSRLLQKEATPLLLEQLPTSAKALLLAWLAERFDRHLVIISEEPSSLLLDLPLFTHLPVATFPAWETLPHEQVSPSSDVVGARHSLLHALRTSQQPRLLLSNLQALLQKVISPDLFEQLYLTLKVGDAIGFEQLRSRIEAMGYQRSEVAADGGEYAIRGAIVDLYPVGSSFPYRIEFWDDEVERICSYDPISQTSIAKLEAIEVAPGQELELLARFGKEALLFDYMANHPLIIFDDLLAIEDRYAKLAALSAASSHHFCTMQQLLRAIEPFPKLLLASSPIEMLTEVRHSEKKAHYYAAETEPLLMQIDMFGQAIPCYRCPHPFAPLMAEIELPEGYTCQCIAETEEAAQQLLSSLEVGEPFSLHKGYLSEGFLLPELHQLFLPTAAITHQHKVVRRKQRTAHHVVPSQLFDLSVNDLVVHYHHGIGKFMGVKKRPNHLGTTIEYMELLYDQGSSLYVPMQQAHLVSKYIGAGEAIPSLHSLGGSRWQRTREKSEKAIVGYAKELLELYARRQMRQGFAYPPDSPEMKRFEEEFPYIETEDQLAAIQQVKKDMCSPHPMDRLVCGDVGYGKTEVAMRAAFKAIIDGAKQVALLVPTTVLAMQHYDNFVERMAPHGVTIEVLSRFRSAKQIKTALEALAKGTIDLVIGTHRLLGLDVQFHDLGLVIIDEEQRFGVRAKEKLKKFKAEVDCLTLSATPIPRTLHLSLSGARELSIINTPPEERLPITSSIADPTDELLKTALLRELSRGGQAYFIHNRIETLPEQADRIRGLLPQARVAIAHGSMSADELDLLFHAFKKGEVELLISTSIIENGIDIPNANTILIDRADTFGLASLYQMRGRVGRSNRPAYCYFLVDKRKSLPSNAQKRLDALIASSGGWGGGMKIAMRDLEIRGAGNILGTEQSGQVAAIGFHFYCKLLKRTVEKLQGQLPPSAAEVTIDLAIDARLPEDYVNSMGIRMEFYQRFGEAETIEEVESLWKELLDRFGRPPIEAERLYRLSRVKMVAAERGYIAIRQEKSFLCLERKGSTRKIASFTVSNDPSAMERELLCLLSTSTATAKETEQRPKPVLRLRKPKT